MEIQPSPPDLHTIQEAWPNIIDKLKTLRNTLYPILQEAKPVKLTGGELTLELSYQFHKNKLEQKKINAETFLSQFFQTPIKVIIELQSPNTSVVLQTDGSVTKSDVIGPEASKTKDTIITQETSYDETEKRNHPRYKIIEYHSGGQVYRSVPINVDAEEERLERENTSKLQAEQRYREMVETHKLAFKRINNFKVYVVSAIIALATLMGLTDFFGPRHLTENLRQAFKYGEESAINLTDLIIYLRMLINFIAAIAVFGLIVEKLEASLAWPPTIEAFQQQGRKEPGAWFLRTLFGCVIFWVFGLMLSDLMASPKDGGFYLHLAAWGIAICTVVIWLVGGFSFSSKVKK